MAEEAADEVGRSTLFSKGALQIASGLLLAWPASALVQHAGCGALSAICSSGSRETRGTVAMMRLLQVCALMTADCHGDELPHQQLTVVMMTCLLLAEAPHIRQWQARQVATQVHDER